MGSKFQQKIKLMIKDGSKYTTKQFTSAEFLPGSVMDTGTDLQIRLEEATKTNDMEAIRPILRECYDFIADVIFEKQFTGQEYIDGMDARELLKITGQLLGSVTSGYDAIYSEQKKK
ncbi:phage tail assembly chaperone G [Enterococcus faecalis]|uniref:phage tail assembly chaperone G n=1 Tax=Enterococcus faecalis TaxID=1351 RepID=UPI0019E05308|nr:hypothetical protein [Enterococcus faecalis]EGO5823245.1 hypothetical protein [Enterococcus faecalis]EGO6072208.1 hypothetical protein [Enterococcus faecalis]EIY5960682.1 hypothetical protein [Enterococcus faecalis]EKZ0105223.1 hypothetical protein [Enterococcus faecalis]ELZ4719599.1 hypothetical protein [Enterococcus faecalis]